MKFAIKFVGKLKDTAGIYYPIQAERDACSASLAVLALYEQYDVLEVESAEYLENEGGVFQALCDHIVGELSGSDGALHVMMESELNGRELFYTYTFCPDCGVKLT